MDHVVRGQPITFCDFGAAGFAALERAAFSQKLRPCGPMDRAVHAAAAEQGPIGRIDDRVNVQARNVGDDDFQPCITELARRQAQAEAGAPTVTPFSANSCCNSPA